MTSRNPLRYLLVLALVVPIICLGACATESDGGDRRPASANGGGTSAEAMAEVINPERIRGHVRFLSDDLLEGRGPSTRGDDLTQLYLATQMEAMGLEPGAEDGSWLQPMQLVSIEATMPTIWRFQTPAGVLDLDASEEFIAASGVQQNSATVDGAEVVFVGYGIEAPEYEWNDFKDVDLNGKVLLMLNNDPDWDPELFEGDKRLYYGRWTYKYESAARQGAVGAIIIHTSPSAGYPWQVVQTSWTGPQFELPAQGEPRIEVAGWVTEEAAKEMVSRAGQDLDALYEAAKQRDFQPVPLGITTSIQLANRIETTQSANVLGVLPGSDPELADEVVVFTAHHDHLGKSAGAEGDGIYNGALDNALGTASILAIAEAYTRLPEAPRRSSLFLFVAAEEQGLLGSKYYARHPTYPPGKIAANINYDGGNIWGKTEDLVLVGAGKSSLDAVAAAVLKRQGRKVVPDQNADKGYYYRSDQFSLAKIGVPALYFDNGLKFVGQPENYGEEQVDAWIDQHYHQASDELTDDWKWGGIVDDILVGYWAGLEISNADAMPTWNEGDEFEAARKEALAEVDGQ